MRGTTQGRGGEARTPVVNPHGMIESLRRKALLSEQLDLRDKGMLGWEVDVFDLDSSGRPQLAALLEYLLSIDWHGGPAIGLNFLGRHFCSKGVVDVGNVRVVASWEYYHRLPNTRETFLYSHYAKGRHPAAGASFEDGVVNRRRIRRNGHQTWLIRPMTCLAFYYSGYGVLLIPWMSVVDSYGGKTAEYYNAFGLYLGG